MNLGSQVGIFKSTLNINCWQELKFLDPQALIREETRRGAYSETIKIFDLRNLKHALELP